MELSWPDWPWLVVPAPAPHGDPLTHRPLPDGFWWACGYPERRDDEHACYSDQCVACWLALEAMLRTVPQDEPMWWRPAPGVPQERRLALEARVLNLRRLADAGVLRPHDEDLVLCG